MTRRLLLTVLGIGNVRWAPGTWGSLPPIILALLLLWIRVPAWQLNAALALLGLLFAVACLRFGAEEEHRCGRADPGHIVADEVAGQSIVLLFLPWRDVTGEGGWLVDLVMAAIAFASFRVLDAFKPWPFGRLQRLPGGLGILADDLAAGAAALLATHILARLVLAWM